MLIAIAVVHNPSGVRHPRPVARAATSWSCSSARSSGRSRSPGSVIAFGKLAGLGKHFRLFSSAPVVFKGQHWVNLTLALVMIGFGTGVLLRRRGRGSGCRSSS